MIPFRVKNPPESFPIATISLMVINTVAFIATQSGGEIKETVLKEFGVSNLNLNPMTLISSMFLHGDWLHLIFNMLFLCIFGCAVEGRLRTPKFLLLYVLAGIAGDLLHLGLLSAKMTTIPSVGASGAIMGVIGAGLYMFPHAPVCFFWITWYRLSQGEVIVEWPLWWAALYYFAMDMLGAVWNLAGVGGTAHLAHLGGLVGGFLICLLFRPRRDDEYVAEAKKTISETKDYTALWRRQLEDVMNAQPDNHKAAVALMIRAYEENNAVKPEHIEHFKRNFRAISMDKTQEENLSRALVSIVSKDPTIVSAADYLHVAQSQIRAHKPLPARTLLEGARKLNGVPDSDMEAITYQLAQIYDQWLNQPETAYALYYEIYQKWPMSPLVPTLTTRMQEMYPAVQAAAAARAGGVRT